MEQKLAQIVKSQSGSTKIIDKPDMLLKTKNQFDIVMDTDAGSGVVYYNTNEFYWNLPSGGGNAYYGFKIQDDSLIYYLHYLESEYTQYPPTNSTCLTNTKVRFV